MKNINSYKSGIKLYFVGKNAIGFLNFIYDKHSVCLSRKKAFYDIWKTWKSYEGTHMYPSKRKLNRKQKGN